MVESYNFENISLHVVLEMEGLKLLSFFLKNARDKQRNTNELISFITKTNVAYSQNK